MKILNLTGKIELFKLILIFVLFNISNLSVFADEIMYPPNTDPLIRSNPIAGETYYDQRPVYKKHNGINFFLYNDASGELDLNLDLLQGQHTFTSIPVVSPNFNNIIYTQVFYYPTVDQVVSKAFFAPVVMPDTSNENKPPSKEDFLNSYKFKTLNNYRHEILSTESEEFERNIFRTLTVVDWSYDSNLAIIKERIGAIGKGITGTSIWVYNVAEDKIYLIDTIRKGIINYWLTEKSLDLTRYFWDIKILGWEKDSKNRIIVNAYMYPNKNQSTFLGCWNVNIATGAVKLISLEPQEQEIERSGLIPEDY